MDVEGFDMVKLSSLEDATRELVKQREEHQRLDLVIAEMKRENTELRLYIEKIFAVLQKINLTADVCVKTFLTK
jgi:hypothetical protein